MYVVFINKTSKPMYVGWGGGGEERLYLVLLAPIGKIGLVYPCLTIVVTGLKKPYSKTEAGAGLVVYNVKLKTCNVDVQYRLSVFRIEIPGIHFWDQKYSNENIQTTEFIK
jgi:hypothetical protein